MTTPACNGFLRLLARIQSFTPIGQTLASDATSPQGDKQGAGWNENICSIL
jgi:hypothetical protein